MTFGRAWVRGARPLRTALDLARGAAQAAAWRRFWSRQGVWWARATLAVAALVAVVAAHLYLANQAVVLWEDIRTMQYASWQLWWDIVTWQTDLAEQRNAHVMQAIVEEEGLTWPDPQGVLYVPVTLPSREGPRDITVPGVWSPPSPPEGWLPSAYTLSGSQWLAQGGARRLWQWLGLPPSDLAQRP